MQTALQVKAVVRHWCSYVVIIAIHQWDVSVLMYFTEAKAWEGRLGCYVQVSDSQEKQPKRITGSRPRRWSQYKEMWGIFLFILRIALGLMVTLCVPSTQGDMLPFTWENRSQLKTRTPHPTLPSSTAGLLDGQEQVHLVPTICSRNWTHIIPKAVLRYPSCRGQSWFFEMLFWTKYVWFGNCLTFTQWPIDWAMMTILVMLDPLWSHRSPPDL